MHFFYPYTSSSKVVQSFGTLSPYFCAINKNLTVMVLGNRINVTQRAGADGWDRVEVKSGDRSSACSYQIKQQITIKLGAPYNDTITIETSEPISDKSDIAQFAKDMLYAAELRHETNRKQKIAGNKEFFRSRILPLWFEREAYKARSRAEEQDVRKKARRDLNAGTMDLKAYNDHIRALNSNVKDDDYIDDIIAYNRRLSNELDKVGVGADFHFSYCDIERLIGKNMWQESLQIKEYMGEAIDMRLLNTVRRGLENFNRLYNLELQHLTFDQMRARYDHITTAGFGEIVLAAAFYKDGNLCAVMAIDDCHGRCALSHLVGGYALAEVLPKMAYNAVVRDDRVILEGVEYTDSGVRETIIIE